MIMCSAIFLRITDIGSTRSPAPGWTGGACIAGGCGSDGAGCAGFDKAEDVVFRDTPAHPRTFELGDVDVVFARDVAHQRTGLRAAQVFN
jgi:hypothetical protein